MLFGDRRFFRESFALLSSMRFAVSLLIVLSAASVIGTVVLQNQPNAAYVNQFGLFWFPVFKALGLYMVYNTPWYLGILAILVLSIGCCVYRQTIFAWHRQAEPFVQPQEKFQIQQEKKQPWLHALKETLRIEKFSYQETTADDGTIRITAKNRPWHFMGYLLTHLSIVVICLGALIDSQLALRIKMYATNKEIRPLDQDGYGVNNILSTPTLSYRGHLFLSDNQATDRCVINLGNGTLIQKLPFTITLKNFQINFYTNGVPQQFSSDIVLEDHQTHKKIAQTLSVNQPLQYKKFTIYQSGFTDGGSQLTLEKIPLNRNSPLKQKITIHVGERHAWGAFSDIEFTDFKYKNIENVKLLSSDEKKIPINNSVKLISFFSSAAKLSAEKFVDLGPSFTYRIHRRDGSVIEYQNFSRPIQMDKTYWLFFGIRQASDRNFRYLKIPTDSTGRLRPFLHFRQEISNPQNHQQVITEFLKGRVDPSQKKKVTRVLRGLLFSFAHGGFPELFSFLHIEAKQKKLTPNQEQMIHIFEKICFSIWQKATINEHRVFFDDLLAVSDSLNYPESAFLVLKKYLLSQDSILEITRSPGAQFIYIGALTLCLGLLFLLYLSEKKLFFMISQTNNDSVDIFYAINRAEHRTNQTFLENFLRKIKNG